MIKSFVLLGSLLFSKFLEGFLLLGLVVPLLFLFVSESHLVPLLPKSVLQGDASLEFLNLFPFLLSVAFILGLGLSHPCLVLHLDSVHAHGLDLLDRQHSLLALFLLLLGWQ